MPYISITSPRGHRTFDVDEKTGKELFDVVHKMLMDSDVDGNIRLNDGYNNIVMYSAQLLRESEITFGGFKIE